MHGSTSPANSGVPCHGPRECHVALSRTRPIAFRASSLEASRPMSRSMQQGEQRDPLRLRRASVPQPILPPESQQPRAPAFGGNAGTLRGDLVGRRIGQVAHRLPANRRVRIEQPVERVHWAGRGWLWSALRIRPKRSSRPRNPHRSRQKLGYNSDMPKVIPYRGAGPSCEMFQKGSTKRLMSWRPILKTRPTPRSRGRTCLPLFQLKIICGCDRMNQPLPS